MTSNPPPRQQLRDPPATARNADPRHPGVQIDHVGICDLMYPVVVLDRDNQRQQATATIAVSVSLPHHFKGTHMSRFLEVSAAHQGEITMRTIPVVLAELKRKLAAPLGAAGGGIHLFSPAPSAG